MLLEKLANLSSGEDYPMHMPGHKRNTGLLGSDLPYALDITEISGFDNLHNPHGILKDTAELAARLYKCKKAFALVGGSTAGVLAAIGAAASRGGTILIARNCHISVYNAAGLFGLKTAYILPERDESSGVFCSVSAESVRCALTQNPGIRLVVITSPTYEGVVSDIAAIAAVVHEHGAMLFVDSAHGAHFGFSDFLPESAAQCGADLVVTSLHKTLPALTQCALLLVCSDLPDDTALSRLLSVFQTSSPSYVLLASIDRCLRMLDYSSALLYNNYAKYLNCFSRNILPLANIGVLCHGSDNHRSHPGFFAFDPGKLVITTHGTNISGTVLADTLRVKYKIESEMACINYALAMTSICDTQDGFLRLAHALLEIDRTAETAAVRETVHNCLLPEQNLSLEDALSVHDAALVPLENAAGFTSLEFVWAYPPGIPIIVPGEIISCEIISEINRLSRAGVTVMSTCAKIPLFIRAVH